MLLKTKRAIKWIDALLDPKFKKGVGQLQTSDGKYCCLGVGCKVTKTPFRPKQGTSLEFADKVGLNYTSGIFNNKLIFGCGSLIQLNDHKYVNSNNFLMIRKHILANLKHIFEPEVAKELKTHYGK